MCSLHFRCWQGLQVQPCTQMLRGPVGHGSAKKSAPLICPVNVGLHPDTLLHQWAWAEMYGANQAMGSWQCSSGSMIFSPSSFEVCFDENPKPNQLYIEAMIRLAEIWPPPINPSCQERASLGLQRVAAGRRWAFQRKLRCWWDFPCEVKGSKLRMGLAS